LLCCWTLHASSTTAFLHLTSPLFVCPIGKRTNVARCLHAGAFIAHRYFCVFCLSSAAQLLTSSKIVALSVFCAVLCCPFRAVAV
jgi:hypothetical protein